MLIHKTSNKDLLNLREEVPNVIKSQKMSLNFGAQLKDLSQKVDEMFNEHKELFTFELNNFPSLPINYYSKFIDKRNTTYY